MTDLSTTPEVKAVTDPVYLGKNYGMFDVVSNYRWTLSKNFNKNTANSFDEVPYVKLVEYEINESTIINQVSFYSTAATNKLSNNNDPMAPYENLFPRQSTGNAYRFPYFSDVNFEVNTPVWASLDTLEQGGKAVKGALGVIFGEKAAEAAGNIGGMVASGVAAGLSTAYPKVGIMDRPRLWQNHDFRSINIKFPLFNTVNPDDWKKNRSLCWSLVNSNLYKKNDFITGVPPVYYEIIIPGQHYSYASCVTNLVVYNRGNMRVFKDDKGVDAVVPDAFEVNITLTDMVMPSRNLFQQAFNPKVVSR